MVDIANESGDVLWRTDEPTLARADLCALDLSHAQLPGAELVGANLWNAGLEGANLIEANLAGADLRAADLTGALLVRADCRNANFFEASMGGADLSGAILCRANFYHARLSKADLSGAALDEAVLYGATLDETTLTAVSLRGADLRCASLHGAQLREADLAGARTGGAAWGLTTEWPKGFSPKGKGLHLVPPEPPIPQCCLCGVSSSDRTIDFLDAGTAHAACVVSLAERPEAEWIPPGAWPQAACIGCGGTPSRFAIESKLGVTCAMCIGSALAVAEKGESLPDDATSILAALAPGAADRDRFLVLANASLAIGVLDGQSPDRGNDFVDAVARQLSHEEGRPLDLAIRRLAILACIALGERMFPVLLARISSEAEWPLFRGNAACVLGFGAPDRADIRSLLELLAQAPEPEIRAGVHAGLAPHDSPWVNDVVLRAAGPGLATVDAAERTYEMNTSLDWSSPEALRCARRALAAAEQAFGPDAPELVRYLNLLYRHLQLVDDHASALPYCQRATALARRKSDSRPQLLARELNNLGLSQLLFGQLLEAEAVLIESTQIAPHFPNPHYWLARLYRQRAADGDEERETEAWKFYILLGGPSKDRCAEAARRLAHLLQ